MPAVDLIAFRHLFVALGVALVSVMAALAIAQAPHFHPVSSQEVDGALDHLGTLVAVEDAAPASGAALSRAGD